MKVLSWVIALCGLWEFGDIAAVFVPDFGRIQPSVWNHIIAGLILMIAGAWAARTSNVNTARTLSWTAAGGSAWLMISSFILRYPAIDGGLWNDLIVGALAFVLSVSAALASARITR
jgi:hypothetical protein